MPRTGFTDSAHYYLPPTRDRLRTEMLAADFLGDRRWLLNRIEKPGDLG